MNKEKRPIILEERKREWLQKFTYCGVPISWANRFFRDKLKTMRKEHPEFDLFLKEIGELLTKEKNDAYTNIIRLINDDAETNWISTSNSILDALIKLFNYCLSPVQTVDYIKKCYEFILMAINEEYEMSVKPQFSICKDHWNGQYREAVEFEWSLKFRNPQQSYDYWFRYKTSLKVVEDLKNDISTQCFECGIVSKQELPKDAFMLFIYEQNEPFLRNLFNNGIKELIKRRLIKKVNTSDFYGWTINEYKMVKDLDNN